MNKVILTIEAKGASFEENYTGEIVRAITEAIKLHPFESYTSQTIRCTNGNKVGHVLVIDDTQLACPKCGWVTVGDDTGNHHCHGCGLNFRVEE